MLCVHLLLRKVMFCGFDFCLVDETSFTQSFSLASVKKWVNFGLVSNIFISFFLYRLLYQLLLYRLFYTDFFYTDYSYTDFFIPTFLYRLFLYRLFLYRLFLYRLFLYRLFLYRLFLYRLFLYRLFWYRLFLYRLFLYRLFLYRLFLYRLFFIPTFFIPTFFIPTILIRTFLIPIFLYRLFYTDFLPIRYIFIFVDVGVRAWGLLRKVFYYQNVQQKLGSRELRVPEMYNKRLRIRNDRFRQILRPETNRLSIYIILYN